MDILEIVYFMSRAGLSNDNYNRLNKIIEKYNREDLYKMSPTEKIEEIFEYLEKNIEEKN